MLARLPSESLSDYGSSKLQLFLVGNVVFLIGGIFVGWRRESVDLLLLLTALVALVGALVLLFQLAGGTASTVLPDRFGVSAEDDPIALSRDGANGVLIAVYLVVAARAASVRLWAMAALPALAPGQIARQARGVVSEAESLEHLGRLLGAARGGLVAQPETDVLGDGEMWEQRVALEDVADAPRLRWQVHHGPARLAGGWPARLEEQATVDDDAALVGTQQAGETLQRERLAGARGAEEHGHAVAGRPRDVEREAGQPLDDADVERAHVARAPSRPAATSTTHESAVRMATRTSTVDCSPVCTAV
jgi:hypothetical protein